MTALEQELTAGFQEIAQGAPSDLGLLSRVQAKAARRVRRRRVGLAAAVAGVAAATVAAVTVLPGGHDSSLQYAHESKAFFTANTAVASFPYTAGYLPPGLPSAPTYVVVTPIESSLTWTPSADGVQGNVQVALSAARPGPDPERLRGNPLPVRSSVQVRGQQGTLSCDTVPSCRLTWQDPSGRWFRVDRVGVSATATRTETLAVAEGLQARRYVPRAQLKVGLVPRACTLAELAPDHLDLAGPAGSCAVSIALVPALNYPGTPTTYGGQRAVARVPAENPTQRQVFVSYAGRQEDVSLLVPRTWKPDLIDALVRSLTVR